MSMWCRLVEYKDSGWIGLIMRLYLFSALPAALCRMPAVVCQCIPTVAIRRDSTT